MHVFLRRLQTRLTITQQQQQHGRGKLDLWGELNVQENEKTKAEGS